MPVYLLRIKNINILLVTIDRVSHYDPIELLVNIMCQHIPQPSFLGEVISICRFCAGFIKLRDYMWIPVLVDASSNHEVCDSRDQPRLSMYDSICRRSTVFSYQDSFLGPAAGPCSR